MSSACLNQSVVLRPPTLEDVEFLARTFVASLREAITAARSGWNEQRERSQFEQQLQLEHTQVIYLDAAKVGFLTLVPHAGEVELHTLCIAPPHQGQGIGSHVTRVLTQSALAGGRAVVLSVLKTNGRARNLYERLGFIAVDQSEFHVRLALRSAENETPSGS